MNSASHKPGSRPAPSRKAGRLGLATGCLLGLVAGLAPGPVMAQRPGAWGSSAGLLLPDLQTRPPSDLRLDLRSRPGRRLLRLSNTVWNAGAGPLEVSGAPDPASGKTRVTQRVLTRGGPDRTFPVGGFVFHPGHRHWHFEGFSEYELWSLAPSAAGSPSLLARLKLPDPLGLVAGLRALLIGRGQLAVGPFSSAYGSLAERLVTSNKVGYCIWDNRRLDARLPGGGPRHYPYAGCARPRGTQGISVGWSDTYAAGTMGQFIDVTGLPEGRYALRSVANPAGLLEESDRANNVAIAYISLSRSSVRVEAVLDAAGPRPGSR